MIKVVKAVLRMIETRLKAAGLTGPNSRERVRETIIVVLRRE
jgi:hypothetical protein